jgi:hypothetical protein
VEPTLERTIKLDRLEVPSVPRSTAAVSPAPDRPALHGRIALAVSESILNELRGFFPYKISLDG